MPALRICVCVRTVVRARALNGMQCSPGGRDRVPSRPFSRPATWLACDPACSLATAQVLTFMMFCKEGLENVPTQIYRWVRWLPPTL